MNGVVYMDDDACVREALSELLACHQIEHLAFGSADQFLDCVRTDQCACLVLDLELPGVNGLDLQRQLGNNHSPPIIFISVRGDVPVTVRAMKAGAIEFLTKPVEPQALIAAIRGAFTLDLEQRLKVSELTALRKRFALLRPREREVLPLVG